MGICEFLVQSLDVMIRTLMVLLGSCLAKFNKNSRETVKTDDQKAICIDKWDEYKCREIAFAGECDKFNVEYCIKSCGFCQLPVEYAAFYTLWGLAVIIAIASVHHKLR